MLVLSRDKDTGVILRDKTTGTVLGRVSLVRGNDGTRLGFEFPDNIEIVREELIEDASNENHATEASQGRNRTNR